MFKRITSFITSLVLGTSYLFAFAPVMVRAAADTCTWTGGGADSFFSTTGNWSCSIDVLESGDALVFDASTVDFETKQPVNDMVGATFTSITWTQDGTNFDAMTITGQAFSLSGDIVATDSGLNIDTNITVTTNVDFGYVTIIGDVALGANTLSASGSTIIEGVLSGSGNINVLANGSLTLEGQNTFTSDITVAGTGSLHVGCAIDGSALGTNAGSTTITDGGSLTVKDGISYSEPISIAGTGTSAALYATGCKGGGGGGLAVSKLTPTNIQTTTFTGAVTLTADTKMSTYYAQKLVFENMTLAGNSLTQTNTSTGTIVYNDETIAYQNKTTTIASSTENTDFNTIFPGDTIIVNGTTDFVDLLDGATLSGSGTITTGFNAYPTSNVSVGNSPGCMAVGGANLSEANFIVEIAGAEACTGYDQLQVTFADGEGTIPDVYLFDPVLDLSFPDEDYLPAAGTKFVIIDNEGDDEVQGTFADLPEGETFESNGGVFSISYEGGDGNDVEITVITAPTAPDTGFAPININSPAAILLGTLGLAGAILVIDRKYKALSRR